MALSALNGMGTYVDPGTVPHDPPTTATPTVSALKTGDSYQGTPAQGGLSEALKAKLAGKVPGTTIHFEGNSGPVDPTALRQVAFQGRKPLGVTHEEALATKRAAFAQLQQAQAGSNVASLATTSLAVIDGASGITAFRRTEFADKILEAMSTAMDDQFLTATVGNPNATSARTMARGIIDTRNTNPAEESALNKVVLEQVQRLASPGSYVASMLVASQQVGRAISAEADKAQLTELALKDVVVTPDGDFALGNDARAVRALAKQAQWVLSATDSDRVLLQTAVLSQVTRMVPQTSRAAAIANEGLRLSSGASSLAGQDAALKYALDSLQAASDSDF